MPKAAIDEYGYSRRRKDEIRIAEKPRLPAPPDKSMFPE